MTTLKDQNVLGAIVFFSYIAAALGLTGLVTSDLKKEFSAWSSRRVRDRNVRVCLFAALSTLSFAVLSYHMLDFLIQSYQSWSMSSSLAHPAPPRTFQTFHAAILWPRTWTWASTSIWTWSISSNLFQDFGEVICNDPHRFWWTQLALVYSFGWNMYMSIQGTRLRIPHHWAYFLLDQILPMSFAQNLFLLGMILREEEEDQPIATATLYPVTMSLQCAVALTYLGVVAAAPYSVATRYFFPVLFATRILLFAPYQALGPVRREYHSEQVQLGQSGSLMKEYSWFFALVLVGGVLTQLAQTARTSSLASTLAALNCNPAVSALGYDVFIGMASLACFVSVGHELTSRRPQAPGAAWKASSKLLLTPPDSRYLHAR